MIVVLMKKCFWRLATDEGLVAGVVIGYNHQVSLDATCHNFYLKHPCLYTSLASLKRNNLKRYVGWGYRQYSGVSPLSFPSSFRCYVASTTSRRRFLEHLCRRAYYLCQRRGLSISTNTGQESEASSLSMIVTWASHLSKVLPWSPSTHIPTDSLVERLSRQLSIMEFYSVPLSGTGFFRPSGRQGVIFADQALPKQLWPVASLWFSYWNQY
jgi:hypothetical protein